MELRAFRTGLGVNPLVLNFRGNALSQLGRFREALQDYREATEIFRKDGWAGPEFGSGQKANLQTVQSGATWAVACVGSDFSNIV